MRTIPDLARAAALLAVALPSLALAQFAGTRGGWTYRFDARQVEGRTDRLGLDYDVEYTKAAPEDPAKFESFGLVARSRGFTSFDRSTSDVNSLSAGVALIGWHYSSQLTRTTLRPEVAIAVIGALEKLGEGEEPTGAERRVLNEFNAMTKAQRRYFTYGLNWQLETTQDARVTQHALGVIAAAESQRLGALLDVVPSTTRSANSTRTAFPVRALVALEYVRPPESATAATILVDTASWRARTELAWSAIVLDRYVLRANWQAHYFIDPPQAVKDSKRAFNNFLETALAIEVAEGTSLVIKYLSGRMPPTYEPAGVSALGLSFSFYPRVAP